MSRKDNLKTLIKEFEAAIMLFSGELNCGYEPRVLEIAEKRVETLRAKILETIDKL